MTTALAIVASLIYLTGYWAYNSPILRSDKNPDLVPWTIWGMNGFLNALTYRAGTGNQVMSLLNEAGAVASFATLLIAIYMRGTGRRLRSEDWLIVGLGACCILASKVSPFFGNTFVLCASTIGMLPIWRKLKNDPKSQRTLPWALWTVALGVNMVVALAEFKHYVELIQPAYYLLLHGAVTIQTAPD